MQRLSVVAQDRFAEAIGYAGEGIEGLETVVAFGQEHSMSARFSHSLEQAFAASLRLIGARTIMTGLLIALVIAVWSPSCTNARCRCSSHMPCPAGCSSSCCC